MRINFKPKHGLIMLLATALLFTSAPSANAIYSPTLSAKLGSIKQHVRVARTQNGVGSFYNVLEKFYEPQPVSAQPLQVPGDFFVYFTDVSIQIAGNLVSNTFDGLYLIIGQMLPTGETITNCRRDDIWEMQALQEEVLNELFKSALLLNRANASSLWNDFIVLDNLINGFEGEDANGNKVVVKSLKTHYKDTEHWFPEALNDDGNFYINCPYGEFQQAFQELGGSWERLKGSFSKGVFHTQWGSLIEQAQARAKQRAAEYIAANQITFTLGGGQGGSPTSLVNGPGVRGLAGDLRTNLTFAKNYANLVFGSVLDSGLAAAQGTADAYNSFVTLDQTLRILKDAQNAGELALDEAETALTFNLTLYDTSEQSLIDMEKTLFRINSKIQEAYLSTASDKNLTAFCEQLHSVASRQCKNKGADIPSCRQ